jgi:hypothetical protein
MFFTQQAYKQKTTQNLTNNKKQKKTEKQNKTKLESVETVVRNVGLLGVNLGAQETRKLLSLVTGLISTCTCCYQPYYGFFIFNSALNVHCYI